MSTSAAEPRCLCHESTAAHVGGGHVSTCPMAYTTDRTPTSSPSEPRGEPVVGGSDGFHCGSCGGSVEKRSTWVCPACNMIVREGSAEPVPLPIAQWAVEVCDTEDPEWTILETYHGRDEADDFAVEVMERGEDEGTRARVVPLYRRPGVDVEALDQVMRFVDALHYEAIGEGTNNLSPEFLNIERALRAAIRRSLTGQQGERNG